MTKPHYIEKSVSSQNPGKSVIQTKEGYKQTEVGMIPEDWEVMPLQNVTQIIGGGTPSSFENRYWNGNINWFTPTEIGENKYVSESKRKITQDGLMNSSTTILPAGTILLTSRAGIGDSAILLKDACTNQGFQSLLPKSVGNEYLYYLINSYYFQNSLISNASGSTFLEISPKRLKAIPIPLPPTLAEQTAIATALSDMDALIEAQEQLIAKKRLIKQGAMQELLKPKEGWEQKTIGQCVEVIGGGTPSSFNSKFWNGKINWFTPTEVGETKYLRESKRKITDVGYSNCSAKLLPPGTILLTSRAGIGDLGILLEEACTNQGFQSLIPIDNMDNEFIYYLMATLKNKLLQNASGSTFLEISPGKLKSIEVIIPEKTEQTAIANTLSDMDIEIDQLEMQLDKYRLVKQGMMQELLTGKKRLINT